MAMPGNHLRLVPDAQESTLPVELLDSSDLVEEQGKEQVGEYVLEEMLGKGGMAEVFRARRRGVKGFERVVCLKRVLPSLAGNAEFVAMFAKEARLAARLSHPNIVQVHDLGEHEGSLYMTMELVRGRDLLAILRACAARRVPMPPEAAAYVLRDVCRALSAAHEHHDDGGAPAPIIHRDVSPQNIMIGDDGVVKLVDFGVAKALFEGGDQTRAGVVKGKFSYLAPELLEGARASTQSDLFSAGVVLHEALTGARLFLGKTDVDTLHRVRTLPIAPPSHIHPCVPPELDHVAMRALARDSRERYARAAEMAAHLEMYCAKRGFGSKDLVRFVSGLFAPESGATGRAPVSAVEDDVERRRRSLAKTIVPLSERVPADSSGEP